MNKVLLEAKVMKVVDTYKAWLKAKLEYSLAISEPSPSFKIIWKRNDKILKRIKS